MSTEEWVQPEWWGPLPDWVGGLLAEDVVVGRSEAGVVYLKELTVYPNGIGFELCARLRGEDPPEPPPDPEPPQPLRILSEDSEPRLSVGMVAMTEEEEEGLTNEPLPTDRVRLAVEFADGRRAGRDAPVGGPGDFSIRAFQEGEPVAPDPRANAVLKFSSGGGSPDSLSEHLFLWPLPEGGLSFSCEWEDAAIGEQRVTIPAEDLREARERAHQAWPG